MSNPITFTTSEADHVNGAEETDLRQRFEEARRLLEARAADQALPVLRDILTLHPDHPDALNFASVAFGQLHMMKEAERFSRQAIAARPDDAGFHLNLANRLDDQERHSEAVASYEKAIELAPGHVPALKSYMNCLARRDHWHDARAVMDKLLPLIDHDAGALAACAEICIGAEDRQKAIDVYQQALAQDQDRVEWLLQLARLAIVQDQLELARITGDRVLVLEENAEMRAMLASIMHRVGDLKTMAHHLEALPEEGDQAANAANLLGMMQASQGKIREGLDNMALTETLAPDAFVLQATRALYLNYDPDISNEALQEVHRTIGRRFANALTPLDQHSLALPHDPERRLRIGFVSPDFRSHSVAYFARSYFGAFDRDRFDVVAYASVAKPDLVSEDLRSLVTEWRNVFDLNDQMLAELIRQDRIDILIDLAGFTRDNRLLVFTARPAPIQMTYIGYPNTTGLPAIDYRITDWITDPEGVDDDYSETLIRMPGCFLNYAIPAHAPPVEPGPCEKRGYITFGSFNNFAKINPKLLALWADVLHAVPDSRILFKSTSSGDPTAQEVIRGELECLGIDPVRVLFNGFEPTPQNHLAVYNEIDIALDTFPYHGTTTTCEALWMGVPVVTLRGDRHASRVGASLLTAIGFPAGIAENAEDYVTTARLLAENPGLLKTARRTLRDTVVGSSLCDGRSHAAMLEQAFRAVWQIWCEQQN